MSQKTKSELAVAAIEFIWAAVPTKMKQGKLHEAYNTAYAYCKDAIIVENKQDIPEVQGTVDTNPQVVSVDESVDCPDTTVNAENDAEDI